MTTNATTTGAGLDLLKKGSVVIDYSSLDRDSLSRDLRTYAFTQFSDRWTNFQASEFAVVFLEIITYIGDLVIYQINVSMAEMHPSTCVRRQSFIEIAKSYDFFLGGPIGATAPLTFTSDPVTLPYIISANTFKVQAKNGTVFMLPEDVTITNATETHDVVAGDLVNNALLGTSNGQPKQWFIIPNTGLSSPMLYEFREGQGNVPTLEIRVDGALWGAVNLEATAQSTDEAYFQRTDENDVVTIFFGDNINGKVPPSGAQVTYSVRLGLDKTSNVNPRTITTILTPLPGLSGVTNTLKASGGSPRQGLLEGKIALPASISSNNRAVVRNDYADVLFDSSAPSFVAKASATLGLEDQNIVWVVPEGGGLLTAIQRNEISSYMAGVKILGRKVDVKDRTDVPVKLGLRLFVEDRYLTNDVVARVRRCFVTEVPDFVEAGSGAFDFRNLGLAARDDAGNPQVTSSAINALLKDLPGLQKVEITDLRTIPATKLPTDRINSGNGFISNVQYLQPRNVPRREFRVAFTSSTEFTVFRRIVGHSTFLADNQLVDDKLDISNLPELLTLPSGTILNPSREQTVTFSVDGNPAVTSGPVITTLGATGSVFGNASLGDEYYVEWEEGTGTLPAAVSSSVVYASFYGDLQWQITAGDTAFSVGDYLLFDTFPSVGDIILRPDELPVFLRDAAGAAVDLTTTPVKQA